MKSFKQYISDAVKPMMDFDAPSAGHQWNKSLRDKDKWPPYPRAKYDAMKRKWRTTHGKAPGHLSYVSQVD